MKALLKIVPYVSGIVAVASNPKGWLLGNAVEYLVIRPVTWVYGYILDGFATAAALIVDLTDILTDPFWIVGDLLVGVVQGVYGIVYGLVSWAPMAAPIATFATVVVVALFTLALGYVLAQIILDLVPGGGAVSEITERFSK